MRVVIAEDSAVLRDSLAHVLAFSGHETVAAVGDGEALCAAVAVHRPDVAVVDVRMPPTRTDEGLRAALELRRDHPDVGVLVFSQAVDSGEATRRLLSGGPGVGYLLKDQVGSVAEFLNALNQVAAGGTVLAPEVVRALLDWSDPAADEAGDAELAALSGRERDVLALMAEGRTNTAIAQALSISEGTVEKRVAGIFTKLDLSPTGADNRRVKAVLRYLAAAAEPGTSSEPWWTETSIRSAPRTATAAR